MGYSISQEQQEILNYMLNDFLTPKQIAFKRRTTVRAVYKTISKLRKKGLLVGGFKKGFKSRGVHKTLGGSQQIRLHNIQESIKIIKISNNYLQKIKKSNKLEFKGITLMLYSKKIEIYSQEKISFFGKTTKDCDAAAIKFFRSFYGRIEDNLNIIIEKERVLNKKWVRRHYALINSEIAKKCNKEKQQLIILDNEDKKQRIITDNSLNLNELEAVHSTKAKTDITRLKFHIEDMINNQSLSNSQITMRINDIVSAMEKMQKVIELKLK